MTRLRSSLLIAGSVSLILAVLFLEGAFHVLQDKLVDLLFSAQPIRHPLSLSQ